ncbi:MAG: prolyl oligopeptidase family serine peptidase [Congregibacter sp.]
MSCSNNEPVYTTAMHYLRAFALVSIIILLAPRANADDLPPLTLDELFATPSLFGTTPSAPRWSPDSQQFAFSWNAGGLPARELWVASADGLALQVIPKAGSASGTLRDFAWLADSDTLISLRGETLWLTSADTLKSTRLADIGAGASTLSVSPRGDSLAYLKAGDLWIIDLETGKSLAMTELGIDPLSSVGPTLPTGRYSRREREIGPGIWGGPRYAWSPDGETIAVHMVDRRGMSKVPFPDYLADETAVNEVRRGYPGEANESRSVALLDVATREITEFALQAPSAHQIVDFSWSSAGALLIDVATDTAEDRWLYVAAPGSMEAQEIWHSHRATRIYTSFASAWHPDGEHVVFLSDLDDRYGLYLIDAVAGAKEPQLLTSRDSDVLGAPTLVQQAAAALSVKEPSVFYAANGSQSHEQQVYRLALASADEGPQQVTSQAGQNTGYPSPDGRLLAYMHSDDTNPPELYLTRVGDDSVQRITHSPLPEFAQRNWARGRYVSFPSETDDYTLHARILEPANLDSGKKYPVLFGPMYSNTVRNRWASVYSEIQQLLVQQGYIVVQVDMRGSTGYGREFREEFLADFAGDDINDIVSTANYIKQLSYVDGERLGIWGSSYGGTLSVYTLLKQPGLFRAGVAAAAAVDPRFFGTDDVAIVRNPDTQAEVFANRAERYAANLEDHLLIIHGMQDQVVPFKTTVALAEALIKEGKDFDFAFAPGATHGWRREAYYSRYLFGKMLSHFDRYLKPDAAM